MTPFTTPIHFEHPFRDLDEHFFANVTPRALEAPRWVHFNRSLAAEMNLPVFALTDETATYFCGNQLISGQQPLAMLYAGHQFGQYVPQLGDGRAMQLGATLDANQQLREWQLKGAGQTPFSRQADGRAVLRSSIREYLCSEAMAGLGIPTTRALALVGSSTPVFREERETAATVVRVAPSFVRFGSFEVFYYRGQVEHIKALAGWVIAQHFPDLADEKQPYLALLQEVTTRTAQLVAHWQAVGFCHGVLNTDNMSVLGLTLDYGPFGFLDAFNPSHICNHSDYEGRYSYENQPFIGSWNLHCFAQAIVPLIGEVEPIKAVLATYWTTYKAHWLSHMRAKLGLFDEHEQDEALINDTFSMMAANHLDFSRFFRRLADFCNDAGAAIRNECVDLAAFDAWAKAYAERLALEPQPARSQRMNAVNPQYVLRNHLAQKAIELAQQGDFSEVTALFDCLQTPFTSQIGCERFDTEPALDEQVEVSCSS